VAGIGRRGALKKRCPKGRAGSSPALGTKPRYDVPPIPVRPGSVQMRGKIVAETSLGRLESLISFPIVSSILTSAMYVGPSPVRLGG
jgi:hypothetical protein